MFKSYKEVGFHGIDSSDKNRSYRIRIIDDDFEDEAVIFPGPNTNGSVASTEIAIIGCYTKRNLPVAPNLIKHMLQVVKDEGWDLDAQVQFQKQYNPYWNEVEKDMQMYLLFS